MVFSRAAGSHIERPCSRNISSSLLVFLRLIGLMGVKLYQEGSAMFRLSRPVAALLLLFLFSLLARAGDIPGLPEVLNGGKPVEITVFWLPQATDAYDIGQKASVAVAQEFMRRYPNVKLKPFSFVKVPAGGASIASDTDILMSMAAGTAADVLVVNFRQSDTYIRQGFLLPLDRFYDQWARAPGGAEELARVLPTPELWKVVKRAGPDGQEHSWALPPTLLVMAMNYRKDLLRGASERIRAVGLDPEKPPSNWDEFYQMGLQVCDPKESIYGYGTPNSWMLTWILWGAGSEILKQDAHNPQEWTAAYDDPGAVQAYKYAWKLVKQPWSVCAKDGVHFAIDPVTGTGECPCCHRRYSQAELQQMPHNAGICVPKGTTVDLWGQGKQAFNISYMDDLQINMNHVDPALIGVATVPKGWAGISSAELNSGMLAINGTLKDPAKIEAAWAYIRFRSSEVAKRLQTKLFVENGFARYLSPTWLRQFGYTAYLRDVSPNWEETYRYALLHGHPEPYGKNAQQIYNEMDIGWDDVKQLSAPDDAAIAHVLHKSVIQTNEHLIGTIKPVEKKKRDGVALLLVIVSLIAFALLLKFTLNTYGAVLDSPNQRSKAELTPRDYRLDGDAAGAGRGDALPVLSAGPRLDHRLPELPDSHRHALGRPGQLRPGAVRPAVLGRDAKHADFRGRFAAHRLFCPGGAGVIAARNPARVAAAARHLFFTLHHLRHRRHAAVEANVRSVGLRHPEPDAHLPAPAQAAVLERPESGVALGGDPGRVDGDGAGEHHLPGGAAANPGRLL